MRFLSRRRRLSRARFESSSASNNSRVTSARDGSRVSEAIAARTKGLRKTLRRNRIVLVTLLVVCGVVAILTGLGLATGTWTLGDTPNAPDPRFGAATAFDKARNRIVVFGGFVGGGALAQSGDTKVTPCIPGAGACGPPILTDGTTWELIPPAHELTPRTPWQKRSPVHSPSPRGFAAVAYDAARKNVVLFGGAPYNDTYNVLGDTWTWDGEDWTLHKPPKPWPDPRQNASMFYDAHRKVVVMFGGRASGGGGGLAMNDTWVWNGSSWKIMPSQPELLPRHSAAVAYDECRAQGVMFGGTGSGSPSSPDGRLRPQPSETWVWDGTGWRQRSPLVSPPGRIGASMVYSRRTGVLLYGGLDTRDSGTATAATDHDAWAWVPNDPTGVPGAPTASGFWERMNSDVATLVEAPVAPIGEEARVPPPPPRAYASFVRFSANESTRIWLFGGTPWGPGDTSTPPAIDNLLNTPRSNQVAYGDQYVFTKGAFTGDGGVFTGNEEGDIPRIVGCDNPVPIPSDDLTGGALTAPETPKHEVRQGMEEIGQLPVLLGADWPANQRDTHVGTGNNRTPNPAYTSAPDCPNRSDIGATSGNNEGGWNTHLVTDPTRNRIYQFFTCDPNRGQGYNTPTQYGNKPAVYNLLIQAYDGTTLKPVGRTLARDLRPSGITFENALIHDAARGRFLLRTVGSSWELTILSQDLIEKGLNPVVGKYLQGSAGAPSLNDFIAIDENFFNHPTTGRPKLFSNTGPGSLTFGPPPAASTPPKLGQWNLETMTMDWEAPVTGCTGSLGGVAMRSGNRVYTTCDVGNSQWAVARVTVTENPDGSETPASAVELFPGPFMPSGNSLTAFGDPQAERMNTLAKASFGTAFFYTVWTFDGKASRWVGRTGIGTASHSHSGGVNANPIRWKLDQQSGRLYAHMGDAPLGNTRGGVRIIDTRLTPMPQPLDFPQFASMTAATPAYLPATEESPRKIFIRVGGPGKMKKYPNWETIEFENEMFYRVLADNIPLFKPASLSDLDSLTLGVPETPGKTEANFDAEGSAYGIRLRSIGGVWSALRGPQQMSSHEMYVLTEDALLKNARHLIPACVFPDRELMAGWVPQARLSDLDALARSSGLEVDSNSKSDLLAPTSRCNPTANASNFAPSNKGVFDLLWPLKNLLEYEANKAASTGTIEAGQDAGRNTTSPLDGTPLEDTPLGTLEQGKDEQGNPTFKYQAPTSSSWDSHFKEVVCVGDALKTYQASVGNIYGSSNCVQKEGLVNATAKGSALGAGSAAASPLPDGFSVGEGYSTVEVSRDKDKGVVVTARAIARGIQIPGAAISDKSIATLTIDRVESIAVAWSNGRAPTDEEIQTLGERTQFSRYICGVHTPDGSIPGCLSSGNQQTFVDNWNKGWGKNSQIYLPAPDPEYLNGSPGGYITGVLKPLANAVEDELFAKDTQKEVPALEVHFYKNSPLEGDARQTLQLAAVRAIAGFGVQCDPDHLFSPQTKSCIAIPDEPLDEEFLEEEDEEFFEDEELGSEGEWIPAEAFLDTAESIGSKIGRILEQLPVLRRLPIREMAEALLAGSVWALLGLPLLFAWRRLVLQMP